MEQVWSSPQVASELADAPLLFNFAEGGKTPSIPLDRLREPGFRIVIFPVGALLADTTAVRKLAAEIKVHGTPIALLSEMISFKEFNQMLGISEIQQLEGQFSPETG